MPTARGGVCASRLLRALILLPATNQAKLDFFSGKIEFSLFLNDVRMGRG